SINYTVRVKNEKSKSFISELKDFFNDNIKLVYTNQYFPKTFSTETFFGTSPQFSFNYTTNTAPSTNTTDNITNNSNIPNIPNTPNYQYKQPNIPNIPNTPNTPNYQYKQPNTPNIPNTPNTPNYQYKQPNVNF